MYTVLIADDEVIIRRGLKKIINWEQLGYTIIAEASDGEEALSSIVKYNPDIVLMDIRMPLMDGLDVIQSARACNYRGKIIILSGFSDFAYAQKAIRYDVKYYLNKPINENELEVALKALTKKLQDETLVNTTVNLYKEKAKIYILKDLINGTADMSNINLVDLYLTANAFQVIIYEKYSYNISDISYNFSEILKVTNQNSNTYENLTINDNEVIILKGEFAINQFNRFLEKFDDELKPQKGSPLDTLFIAYGRIVSNPIELRTSYLDAVYVLQRRFFCSQNQHTIGYSTLSLENTKMYQINNDMMIRYFGDLINYIQSFNRNLWVETLHDLEKKLNMCEDTIADIKLFLTDLFLQIKDKINNLYGLGRIPFPTNGQIINFIETRYYLYEIITFFTEEFEIIMNSIGGTSNDSIVESVIYYIQHNYMENIKLENIAYLFGYNSCYLGKIFHDKTGESFNNFVDYTRIKHSIKLLRQNTMKVYEIAEKVGYRNVEYFYMKFKKHTKLTPTEYRKKHFIADRSEL